MDHLPLPVDKLAHSTLTIPYVCNERFSYDDSGFLTYPNRNGVDIWQLCSDDQIDSDAWAPFLQAWLWFGLLGETIGIGSRTHVAQRITSYASFVETTNDGARFVITKDLHKSIEAASAKNQAPLFSEFHRGRFDTCLTVTARTVKEILSTPSCRTRLAKINKFADLPVIYPVLLSVQILVETLCVSRAVLFPSQLLYTVPDIHPTSELVDYLLKESGWCPSQIPKLSKDVRVRYYLSYLSPFDAQEHKNCSRDECRRRTPDEAQIQPLHTSVGCECSSVSLPDSEVIRIVEDGDIPLVTFSGFADGQRRLEIARYSRNQNESDQLLQFVAVSHVRQVGLGNQGTHSLPYCQLSSLQMIADGLLGASANPTPFWIDTVCLPLHHGMKKRALREINRVYRSAAKVVILDPSLFQSSIGSAQDALFRMRYSLWKSRLWTLQEGILAKELHVRFRNRTIQLDELIKQHEASSQQLLATSPTLQCTDNNWLNSALASFDRDIKTTFKNGNSDVDPHRIRTILRLGYLASPLYRYFCEDWETENSTHVVCALLEVYSSPTITEQCHESVIESGTLGEAIERVRQMANIEIR